MGNFSKDPDRNLEENCKKGYIALHIEQGVPVLDRDLNLLQDLITTTVRTLFTNFIGNGVATDSPAFEIQGLGLEHDFQIGAPGTCLVDGLVVTIETALKYTEQKGAKPLSLPPKPQDTVYLDVWQDEVTQTQDPDLGNNADVGMQTAVRRRLSWFVRVAEGADSPPAPDSGHHHYSLATLQRKGATIEANMVTNRRQTRLNLAAIEQRLHMIEPRLRTVEVHLFAPKIIPNDEVGREFDPPDGRRGEEVTIYGSNFDKGKLQVKFGETEAQVEGEALPQSIKASVPTLPPKGYKITVSTEFGSATSEKEFMVKH